MSKIINDGIYEELSDFDTILDSDYYTTPNNNTPLPVPRNWLDIQYKHLKIKHKPTVYRYTGPAPATTEYVSGKVQLVTRMACELLSSGIFKTPEEAVSMACQLLATTKEQLTMNTNDESFRISSSESKTYTK